ncbi:hypothetical protein BUALT_Bualt17G0023800 [Buddleja alternifolia]|uniref:Protein kinase domain-containing protein n=1 Tax=Buddleja alternifolia TaxID=168488 RepID=A0AAV6W3T5_9LAMI|nr:hypothetical protein BUALT_Bualt17G0023800 [Buddleja alternifolia]
MAAGRHGGYRINEFRDREADFGMPRKEIGYSKGEYDRISNGDRKYERGRGRDRDNLEYRGKVRQKDGKEGEVRNGGPRTTSSRSDSGSRGSGPRRCGFGMDREPGELSSDGSDGAIDLESHLGRETEVKKLENGIYLSPGQNKKRRFSPIVWDKDVTATVKSLETTNLPPPPPLVETIHKSASFNPISDANSVHTSVPNDIKVHISEASPSKIDLLPDLSEFPAETSSVWPEKEPWIKNQGTGAIDGDDYVSARTIISSRWANDADSPADEGEISDYEDKRKLKRKYGSGSVEVRGSKKSLSPELGEVKRGGSEGTRGRSSESDDVRSSSRDSYDASNYKNDHMEIDDDHEYDGSRVSQSDMEFEDGCGSRVYPEPAHPSQRSVNMLRGCRSVDEFDRLNKIDEGTYGVVFRAKDKKTGEIVALKKVKMEKEREGFPLTSLREINILLSFHHPFIVDVKEVVVGSNLDSIFMVMEYMEHDLRALMETMKQPFSQSEVKCLMLQLLGGIKAPELLLGAKQYSTAIDMWSLGCIMAELLSKEPLFNGKTEVDQLDKIFKTLGTPNETIWPGLSKLPGAKVNFVKHKYNLLRRKFPATSFTGSPVLSDAGFDLLNKLLTFDPEKRISAEAALNHEWFREVPLPKSKEFMPTFPAQHAQDRRTRRVMKSPDPLEEQRRKELLHGELGTGGLFGQ